MTFSAYVSRWYKAISSTPYVSYSLSLSILGTVQTTKQSVSTAYFNNCSLLFKILFLNWFSANSFKKSSPLVLISSLDYEFLTVFSTTHWITYGFNWLFFKASSLKISIAMKMRSSFHLDALQASIKPFWTYS